MVESSASHNARERSVVGVDTVRHWRLLWYRRAATATSTDASDCAAVRCTAAASLANDGNARLRRCVGGRGTGTRDKIRVAVCARARTRTTDCCCKRSFEMMSSLYYIIFLTLFCSCTLLIFDTKQQVRPLMNSKAAALLGVTETTLLDTTSGGAERRIVDVEQTRAASTT